MALTLTPQGLHDGLWTGVLTSDTARKDPPPLQVVLGDTPARPVDSITQTAPNAWDIKVALPASLMSNTPQCCIFLDPGGPGILHSFVVTSGPLGDDLAAEMAQMRAEMDLMKRLLRQVARN